MSKILLLSISCAALMVSACDHYSTKLVEMGDGSHSLASISPAAGGDQTFSDYLANEYYHLARYENNEMYDYKAAKYYTHKAEALSRGQMVSPASLSDFGLKPEKAEELARARVELIDALTIYNIPENRYALAMAQTRYDCWAEQLAESHQEDEIITCKNEFRHSMASLVPPDGRDVTFAVPFEAESMVLSEEARISLGRAVMFWRNNQSRGYDLTLRPATNVPKEEMERQLSMVRSILQFNGVPASQVDVATDSNENELFEILLRKKDSAPQKLAPDI